MRIAVPRGALLAETLDLLDGLGLDTREVRANDRKLLFEDAGLITMRPSDVPIYVEAGAADLGVTGKDVLSEHPERAPTARAATPERAPQNASALRGHDGVGGSGQAQQQPREGVGPRALAQGEQHSA